MDVLPSSNNSNNPFISLTVMHVSIYLALRRIVTTVIISIYMKSVYLNIEHR